MEAPLIIKEFQSHESSTLPILMGGVNVIWGDSRSGKSAVIRALEALILNAPVYRRDGTRETRIEWQGIERVRSNAENKYVIDGVDYKAMRTSVPKGASDRFKMTSNNFRPQHEPYFLLQESPGAVAREMNSLADLGLIDFVSARLASERRAIDSALTEQTNKRETLQGKIKALDWVEEAEALIAQLTSVTAAANSAAVKRHKLLGLLDGLSEIREKLDYLEGIEDSLQEVEQTSAGVQASLVAFNNLKGILVSLGPLKDTLAIMPVPDKALLDLRGKELASPDPAAITKLREDLEVLKEFEADLRECQDPTPDITLVREVASNQPDSSKLLALGNLLSDLKALPEPAPAPDDDLIRIGDLQFGGRQKMQDLFALMKLVEQAREGEAAVAKAEAKVAEASAQFLATLEEAGQCPLCGRM